MHISCHRHSTGSARAAADYLVGERGLRRADPARRRGSAGEPRPCGCRRRLAGVRAHAHLGGDRVGAGGPSDRRADRGRPRRVREDSLGGAGPGPLRLDGGPAPRARRRGPRACPRRTLRPGDGPQPEHRAARLGEDLRHAARRLQPPARLGSPRRPGAGQGAATGPSRLRGGGTAPGRSRSGTRPGRVDPRLPPAACPKRVGAEPRRRGQRAGGSRPRGAPPGQGLPDRP